MYGFPFHCAGTMDVPFTARLVWQGEEGAGDARLVGVVEVVAVGIMAPGVEIRVWVTVCVAFAPLLLYAVSLQAMKLCN